MHTLCCKCHKPLTFEDAWYGLHVNCFKKWFKVTQPDPFEDLVARSQSQAPHETSAANISFFNGAYRKYSARLDKVSYILKVQQDEYPELPATEFLCNQIYESLKIKIPGYYLIQYPDKEYCFVTRNFMSPLTSADLIHIYHFVKNEMSHNCESLVRIIGEQTGRRTEQERFVYLTLADSLIGNNDRHGRNLGFIQSASGMRLAPFYDNPSALAIEHHSFLGADLQPRGSIFTQATDKPTIKDYLQEWKRLGYEDVVNRFRKEYSLKNIERIINKSFLSEKRKNSLLRLITKRGEELCEN